MADEQASSEELQVALDWACGKGGADCGGIQPHQPCFLPNTVKDHASFAFNSYYQKFKHKGATCYFNSAAMITDLDPSKCSAYFWIIIENIAMIHILNFISISGDRSWIVQISISSLNERPEELRSQEFQSGGGGLKHL